MRLNNLKPRPGAKHRSRRAGRGESSGLGKTSGRGNKGQKARSGSSIRPGFEGGQMPLARRLPRYGFNNKAFATRYTTVNVSKLEEFFETGDNVDEASLREKGLMKGHRHAGVKILGDGDLTKKLSITANKISASAREKIEAVGGSVTEVVVPPAPKKGEKTAVPKGGAKAKAKAGEVAASAALKAEKKPKAKKKAEPKVEAAEPAEPAAPDDSDSAESTEAEES